jgi:hypothetical protein
VPEPPCSGLDKGLTQKKIVSCYVTTDLVCIFCWGQREISARNLCYSLLGQTLKTSGLETVAKAELAVEQHYASNETCCATLFRVISFIITGPQAQEVDTKVSEVWNVKRFAKFVYHFAVATGFHVSRV